MDLLLSAMCLRKELVFQPAEHESSLSCDWFTLATTSVCLFHREREGVST